MKKRVKEDRIRLMCSYINNIYTDDVIIAFKDCDDECDFTKVLIDYEIIGEMGTFDLTFSIDTIESFDKIYEIIIELIDGKIKDHYLK